MQKQKVEIDEFSKLNLIEDENVYFEDINELDKFLDSIDNMEE